MKTVAASTNASPFSENWYWNATEAGSDCDPLNLKYPSNLPPLQHIGGLSSRLISMHVDQAEASVTCACNVPLLASDLMVREAGMLQAIQKGALAC